MTPSQVRAELLGEHYELRRQIEEALAMLEPASASVDALRAAIEKLATTLAAHAKHEQEATRVILERIGERARERNAVMDDAHVAAHARLVTKVKEAGVSDDAAARSARVKEVLAELESHMVEEEAVLLAEDLFEEEPDAPET
jgi:hemerythrin